MGVENARNVLASVETIFQERKEVRDNASVIFKDMFNGEVKYQQYKIADIKMLQILLGTVYWQRQKGSCMFCKCNKRDGVINNQTHICNFITDKEHLKYYNKAQGMYQTMYEKHTDDQGETNEKKVFQQLHEWAGNFNFGITGLGIHPDILPISMVRPDVFHLCMGVTKRLLKHTQFILSQYDKSAKDKFERLIARFLSEEEILIWKLKKPIDSYKGEELKKFTRNFCELAERILEKKVIEEDEDWNALMEAIKIWPKLHKFIVKAKVNEGDDYEAEVVQFEKEVKEFYEFGKECFLRDKHGIDGAGETTYLHILRYNLATFARQIYNDHGLGIGVFTMQGVERRNKESKHIFTHHTNNKGNLSIITLKGLIRMFKRFFNYD